MRIVWQTVRRITNEILRVKGLRIPLTPKNATKLIQTVLPFNLHLFFH